MQLPQVKVSWLQEFFDERECRLIANCRAYAEGDPAGMPGHNLAIIVTKMVGLLDAYIAVEKSEPPATGEQ